MNFDLKVLQKLNSVGRSCETQPTDVDINRTSGAQRTNYALNNQEIIKSQTSVKLLR